MHDFRAVLLSCDEAAFVATNMWLTLLFKLPLANAVALCNGDILLFVCLSVRLSVTCEIC